MARTGHVAGPPAGHYQVVMGRITHVGHRRAYRVSSVGDIAGALTVPVTVLVALLVASVGCRPTTGSTVTTFAAVRDAVVLAARGGSGPATPGQRLQAGDSVRTGAAGEAVLGRAGRRLLLGPDTLARVDSGSTATLVRGTAFVDRRRGPALRLTAGEVMLRTGRDAVARVERGYALRIGVFDGTANVRTRTGRGLDVTALHQVIVSARGLPSAPAPLALVGDRWERALAPDLITSNTTLTQLAVGLDTGASGGQLAAAVPASFTQATSPTAGEPPSEVVLPLAITRVSRAKGPEPARYGFVRALRADGGSWGVVAALASARTDDVGAALADLLDTAAPTQPMLALGAGSGAAAPASGTTTPGAGGLAGGTAGRPGGAGGTPAGSGSPGPGGGSPSGPAPVPAPGPGPGPSPSPSPSPAPGPVDPVLNIIDGVIGILPPPPTLALALEPSPAPSRPIVPRLGQPAGPSGTSLPR